MSTKKQIRSGKTGMDNRKETGDVTEISYMTPSGIRLFIQEVIAEFKKIVWPEKKVTAGLTGFVILLVTVISIYLGSVDLLIGKLVTYFLN
jgi:preprotein translocase subunit SecE